MTIIACDEGTGASLEFQVGRVETLSDADAGTRRIAGVIATDGDKD